MLTWLSKATEYHLGLLKAKLAKYVRLNQSTNLLSCANKTS